MLLLLLACTTSTGPDSASAPDSGSATTDGGPLSLLTLNLHCFRLDGTDFGSNPDRFDAIATTVAAESVRVIAVQEACERTADGAAIETLAGALEDATGADWHTAWTPTHLAWEGTDEEALEGVGLLARGGALDDATALTYQSQDGLQRTALSARLPEVLGGLRVHVVHLDHADADNRVRQARESAVHALATTADDLGVLVAGDLNAPPDSSTHDAFQSMGFEVPTAALDDSGIDHVLHHRDGPLTVDGARRLFDGTDGPRVSDHPGIAVDVSPRTAPAATLTRFVAEGDLDSGHHPYLRGDTAPLSWDWGWPARQRDDGTWEVVISEWTSEEVGCKWVLDDVTWQQGPDEVATAGRDHLTSPRF